jgi:CheY-like chemotaxis protein
MADVDKILIVDDEETLTWSMSKSLSKDKDKFEVLVANSAEDALKVLEKEKIRLVITDIRMPGISGLDLLSKVRREYPDVKVIIMTAYGSPDVQKEANVRGSLYYIEKPFEIKEIRQMILDSLKDERKGFEGQLQDLLLTDVIQMNCLGKAHASLIIRSGAREGKIYFKDGNIIHSETGDVTGEEAFYQILTWPEGTFLSKRNESPKKRTITSDWQFLIMEGLRIADEASRTSHEPGGSVEEISEEVKKDFFEHFDQGFRFLRENKYNKARKEWEKALEIQPDNEMVKFNLKKLGEREGKAKQKTD